MADGMLSWPAHRLCVKATQPNPGSHFLNSVKTAAKPAGAVSPTPNLLGTEDLPTQFFTAHGPVRAVDGVS